MAKTLKEMLVARLEGDIEQHKINTAKELEDLEKAVEDIKALSDDEIEGEVVGQVDNVRYLAQFTSVKKVRDAAIERMNKKGGEIKPDKKQS